MADALKEEACQERGFVWPRSFLVVIHIPGARVSAFMVI